MSSQPCAPTLSLPLTHTVPRRQEVQAQGSLEGRVAFISSSHGAATVGGVVRQPGSCGLHSSSGCPAVACVPERGQLNCTTASMEMLLKHCISQHVCGSQECRCRDINNNIGHKIPAAQNQSISLSTSTQLRRMDYPPVATHLHEATCSGHAALTRLLPHAWPPHVLTAPSVTSALTTIISSLSLLRKPVGC